MAEKLEVIWSADALEDIQNIFDYIAVDSSIYADRLITRIFESTQQLENFPRSGRMVRDLEDPSLRELIVGNYRIFYEVREREVRITTVINGGRNLDF